MTSGITSGSVDLDLLFAPHVTSNAATTGITSSGTDISLLYDVVASPAQYNAGTRIPATAITAIGGTNLASIFCGNVGQYSLSTPANGTKDSGGGWSSPRTWTHTITVTFSSATALTNYFFYGGRIQLSPTQGAGTVADNTLATMFSNMGTLVIYDAGHYRTGTGGTISNASTGGSNIGTTPVALYNTTDGFPYSGSTYSVSMVANAAAGSATVLTITTTLDLVTYGDVDTYTGTYTSNVQQRNHPSQTVPAFSSTMVGTTAAVVTMTINSNIQNFNAYNNRLTSQHGAAVTVSGSYTAGATINVIINSGVVVGALSTGVYGFDTGTGWSVSDLLTLTNNGYVVGAGGNGAAGEGVAGSVGGPALRAQRAISITNNNIIGGGGGGGGSGGAWVGITGGQGGGGGGAGFAAGLGGAGQPCIGYPQYNGTSGTAGTLTTGGAGGPGGAGGGAGGGSAGGNLGVAGTAGTAGSAGPGGLGGAAGPATNGNANITWIAVGTRYGTLG